MTIRFPSALLALLLGFAFGVAWGQQPREVPVVGFLATASIPPDDPLVEAFRNGLRELGYVEGKNIKIEFRSAQGQVDRLPLLVQEMVQAKVNAIIVGTEPAVRAATQATSTTPVVAISFDYDPVASGLIKSYSHPEANVTGIYTRQPELIGKRLEMLKEAVPGLSRVAVFWDTYSQRQFDELQQAARSLGVQIQSIELRGPYDFKAAFRVAKQKKAGALVVLFSPVFYRERARIAALALEAGLPTMNQEESWVAVGGFISYGPTIADTFGRAAYFVDRLLKGAKPGDLPVEQATSFKLTVNLRTAKTLGLTIPQSILLRADEVIR